MTSETPPELVVQQQDPVPAEILSLSSMTKPDYVDMFTMTTENDMIWTPEEWGRAMFGDSPDFPTRLIFRGILGLRITREPSPDQIAGGKVTERGDDWLRIEAHSPALSDNMLIQTRPKGVSIAVFMKYHRRSGKWRWMPLSAVHRRLAPGLLRSAYRHLQLKADKQS